jgi:hypothetical protein
VRPGVQTPTPKKKKKKKPSKTKGAQIRRQKYLLI